jgi:hypothetical protein
METYPRAAVERAMKVQEVIMRAMAKQITWTQVGEIIGLCDWQMRRWKERYIEFGYDGLFDHRVIRQRIADAFSNTAAIEHVGNTAVPDLAAKPIIDIDVLLISEPMLPTAIECLRP